ncbi:MAG: hypothetical protein WBA54_01390 [Acidaminobacteraceae bacterium]
MENYIWLNSPISFRVNQLIKEIVRLRGEIIFVSDIIVSNFSGEPAKKSYFNCEFMHKTAMFNTL